MPVCILESESASGLSKSLETRLIGSFPDLRVVKDMDEVERIRADHSELIIVIVPFTSIKSVGRFVAISSKFHESMFFILVSKEIAASDYKRLLRTGNCDWIAADGPIDEILEIISRQKRSTTADSAPQKPTVSAFLPSAGGVGNTTIALEVAMHVKLAKASRSWRTCYVDLDFQTSHVCDYLDLEPRLQIQEIVEQPERLDQQLFELFASRHPSGLDIFATPRSHMDLCAIELPALDRFLGMVSSNYDFIVVDLPVVWLDWTIPVLESSDVIVVTGLNTIPGLRQLKNAIESVFTAKRPNADVAIVVNRATKRLLGGIERRAHVDSVLAGQKLFFIREDPEAVNRLNAGTSGAETKSGLNEREFVALSEYLATVKTRHNQPIST
jgi:cellulose biosynthesis protein BcsQ